MRLAYFAPAVLGLFLVGCGNDEPERVTPPPATTEQPQAPATSTPPADTGTGTGTMQNDTQTGPLTEDEPVMQDTPPAGGMNDPQSGGTPAPGTTGTGTGTTGTGTGTN